jgi:transcriptional regulator with XRE-family HTH domain
MYGERIRELRKEKNMSLKQLAEELDMPLTTLGNYEREERHPDFDTTAAIASYFGVTIDYLIGRSEKRTYDEHVFRNDSDDMQELLKNADPKVREKIVDVFDQLYLIVRGDMKKGSTDLNELEHLHEIINFIFRMKNGFGWRKRGKETDLTNTQSLEEFMMEYLLEKPDVDQHYNKLLDIYSEKNKEYFQKCQEIFA